MVHDAEQDVLVGTWESKLSPDGLPGAKPFAGIGEGGGAPIVEYTPPALGEAVRVLMRVDALLPRSLATQLHTLYLSCLLDSTFKRAFGEAICDMYLSLAVQYAGGIGTRETTLFGFSVQLFTTPSLVYALLPPGLLIRVLIALDYTLHAASVCDAAAHQESALERINETARSWTPSLLTGSVPALDCEASALTFRRYEYVVRDLEYILTIDGVARQLAMSPTLLRRWLKILMRLQYADRQLRFLSAHIEHDSRTWIQAFNLHLTLSSTFATILKPLTDLAASPGMLATISDARALEAVPLAVTMSKATARELSRWIGQAHVQLIALPLPPTSFDGADGRPGVDMPTGDFFDGEMSRGAYFHIPLHRFYAAMIRAAATIGSSASVCVQVLDALCSSLQGAGS